MNGAEVLDMESAGVAQVAYANRVPFIAFRSRCAEESKTLCCSSLRTT